MAQIDRAVSLLQSNDEIDNRNGCALVINAAATSGNIPDIINQGCIPLIVRRMNTNNDDLKMKCCWAINNLCVHDNGREAVHRAGVVNHFPAVLQSHDSETLKKACWALTNLARHPQAAQEIVRSGCFAGLIKILTTGDSEVKAAALQPLCNLVLDSDHQMSFFHAMGLRPVIGCLSSSDSRTKELAVTLVSFVTTSHDQIREELLRLEVLRPLNKILNGEGTEKMQELTLNTLVNLSLADVAEDAILNQGSVSSVVGLLRSSKLQLQTQAAMLLSNLLGNSNIRAHIRYLSWMEPLLAIISSAPASSVQQAVRCIVNITFDSHCRYMLTRSGAEQKLKAAASRCGDSTVSSLVETACKNFGVLVSADIQREVDDALRSGRVQNVAAPSSQKAASHDDFKGLDDILGGSAPAPKPSSSTSYGAKKPATASASAKFDDLDALLDPPSKPASSKPATVSASAKFDDLDALLDTPAPKPSAVKATQAPAAPKPAAAKPAAKPSNNFDDLDNLLSDLPKPAKAPSKQPANSLDDLDSLLGDMSIHSKPSGGHSGGHGGHSGGHGGHGHAPSHKSSGMDDIESLLADMAPAHGHGGGHGKSSHKNHHDDDIDSLLADLDGGHHGGGHRNYHGGDQSIDDLLAGLGPTSHHHRGGHGHDAIDDLLNDLTK